MRFFSRKNVLTLIELNGEKAVKKQFASEEGFLAEKVFLTKNRDAPCFPRLLSAADNCIYKEYIEGVTLLDALENSEKQQDIERGVILVSMLAKLLIYVNRDYGYSLSDLNFMNFVVSFGKLYAVDFEEAAAADLESDVGKAAAFLLTYEKSDTPYKKQTAKAFLNCFSDIDYEKTKRVFYEFLDELRSRRNKEYFGVVFPL